MSRFPSSEGPGQPLMDKPARFKESRWRWTYFLFGLYCPKSIFFTFGAHFIFLEFEARLQNIQGVLQHEQARDDVSQSPPHVGQTASFLDLCVHLWAGLPRHVH